MGPYPRFSAVSPDSRFGCRGLTFTIHAKCDSALYKPELEKNLTVCTKCEHHIRIGARRRIDIFLDKDGRNEVCTHIEPVDRLKFKDISII